jgi:N-acetylated-alpha-linked acidic dipeptidase
MRLLLYLFLLIGTAALAEDAILGFDPDGSQAQQALEAEFDSHLNADDMDAWLRELSSAPHHVGSPRGREVVEFVATRFRSWGYDTEIAEYEVLFPSPRIRELELVYPSRFSASLTEDSLAEDPSTSNIDDLLPPYNAFSSDGDVEGELVFVNYGTPDDYEILDRYGISVEGKIVIARYGGSWRGIKPKLAGEKGAIGTIIYSDPEDDGLVPAIPTREDPSSMKARCSVARSWTCPVTPVMCSLPSVVPPPMPSASRSQMPQPSPESPCYRFPIVMPCHC